MLINPANIITSIRFVLGIFMLYFLTNNYSRLLYVVLYLIFAFLDILDGFIARKFKCETRFGKNFDLFTDSLICIGIVLILFVKGSIPVNYILLVSIPLIVKSIAIARGIKKTRKTFISSKWRKLNGIALYLTVLLFLINLYWALIINYLILVYFYISSVKNIIELNNQTN